LSYAASPDTAEGPLRRPNRRLISTSPRLEAGTWERGCDACLLLRRGSTGFAGDYFGGSQIRGGSLLRVTLLRKLSRRRLAVSSLTSESLLSILAGVSTGGNPGDAASVVGSTHGMERGGGVRRAPESNVGSVHLAYNPSYSACFFSQNSIFLSQKISQQCFSAGL
jgi:hypothetical protein